MIEWPVIRFGLVRDKGRVEGCTTEFFAVSFGTGFFGAVGGIGGAKDGEEACYCELACGHKQVADGQRVCWKGVRGGLWRKWPGLALAQLNLD